MIVPCLDQPVVVLGAVDLVAGVEGDGLPLHVAAAHRAEQAAVMEHQVPHTQGVIRANIISTGGTCARAGHTL